MFSKQKLFVFIVLVCGLIPSAYAGKVELTTYYPAPFGEYQELKATGSNADNNTVALQASGSDTANPGLAVTNANNVGIGTATPAAVLDVRSTTSGLVPPRMTTFERDAIVNPPNGSVIYNTNTSRLEVYTAPNWSTAVGASAGLSPYTGYMTNPSRCPDNSGNFTGDQVCASISKTCVSTVRGSGNPCSNGYDCEHHGGPPPHGTMPAIIFCQ